MFNSMCYLLFLCNYFLNLLAISNWKTFLHQNAEGNTNTHIYGHHPYLSHTHTNQMVQRRQMVCGVFWPLRDCEKWTYARPFASDLTDNLYRGIHTLIDSKQSSSSSLSQTPNIRFHLTHHDCLSLHIYLHARAALFWKRKGLGSIAKIKYTSIFFNLWMIFDLYSITITL